MFRGHPHDSEREEFARSLKDFCLRQDFSHSGESVGEAEVAHNAEIYALLAKNGWTGLSIPEEYGGSGATLTDSAMMSEVLGYYRAPVGGLSTTLVATALLLARGNEEQKRRVLPAISDGAVVSLGMTESDNGSDAAGIRTAARPDGTGNWRISGEKVYTSNAAFADWLVVTTRTSPSAAKHRGLTVFLVPRARAGITVRPLATLGHVDTTIMTLDDVEVSPADVVGELDGGWDVITRSLNSERLFVSADALGLAQRAFDDTVEYVNARTQFGQPIGSFQALQHGLADIATRLVSTRLLVYHLGGLLDSGDPAVLEASMAKLASAELVKDTTLLGLQYMGGFGYTMESSMQKYVRDSLIYPIFGGTSQIQRNIIAARLGIGRP